MSSPLVSIIIPCYNAEQYVAEAIQSALDQTYPNCEIIVIDDGSTDGSLDVIKTFSDRVRWETGPNRGGCVARNRGLELARGEWIQFLDADDRITPEKIESQIQIVRKASHPNSMVGCQWRHFEGDFLGPVQDFEPCNRQISGVDLLLQMWMRGVMFPPHCWLTLRALIDAQGGWNTALSLDQDGEFFGRMHIATDVVYFAEGAMAHYRKPGPLNVSSGMNERAARSCLVAWDSVQRLLLEKKNDTESQRAVLRRLRAVSYRARKYPEVVQQAHLPLECPHKGRQPPEDS